MPRVGVVGRVVVHVAGKPLVCETADLSAGGLFVFPPAKVPSGIAVTVDMVLPDADPLHLPGLITRQELRDGRYGWGIRFVEVTPAMRRLLDEYVLQQLRAEREQRVDRERSRQLRDSLAELDDDGTHHGGGVYMRVHRSKARRPSDVIERYVAESGETAAGAHRTETARQAANAEAAATPASAHKAAGSDPAPRAPKPPARFETQAPHDVPPELREADKVADEHDDALKAYLADMERLERE